MTGFGNRSTGVGIGALVLGLALIGCGSQSAEQPAFSPTSTASVPTNELTAEPSASVSQGCLEPSSSLPVPTASSGRGESASTSCGPRLSDQDMVALTRKLPAPNVSTGEEMDWKWDADYADTDGYDPCAALSWITFPIERGTGSSPYTIALFHQGEYLGVTTSRTFGFFPQVERIDDGQISVTYTYAKDGDSNAGASGRVTSTFTWDVESGSVDHRGDLPPQ